jgi:hypothetical protein
MPEMPLLDSSGKPLGPSATEVVLSATMLSPTDVESLSSFLILAFGSVSCSRLVKEVATKFSKAAIGGSIAGNVFLCLLPLKLHRPQDASVSKAVFLVSRDSEGQHLKNGRRTPSNLDRVHNFWVKFRPAAHLWAAFQMLKNSDGIPVSPSEIGSVIEDILLLGDALLSEATAAGLKFDPDPWKLPDAYPGKPCSIVGLSPPTSWEIEQLKEYRAPIRPK